MSALSLTKQQLLKVMQVSRHPLEWQSEVLQAVSSCKSKNSKGNLYVQMFTETVYTIWCNRNDFVFRNGSSCHMKLYREVLYRVALRCHIDVKHVLPNMAVIPVN